MAECQYELFKGTYLNMTDFMPRTACLLRFYALLTLNLNMGPAL